MDLARELWRRDALAAVFSGYPRFKLQDVGLDPAFLHTFPWLQAPYMGLMRWSWFSANMDDLWSNWVQRTLDAHVARNLPDCDVMIAQCRIGVATGAAARRRGVVHVCDRGSAHILHQDRLMREEHDRLGFPWPGTDPRAIERELEEYALSDAVAVPSSFVRDSFVAHGVPAEKLILIPYGVDLRIFQRSQPRAEEFRVLFAGHLGVRKGLHYALQAFKLANLPNARLALAGRAGAAGEKLLRRFPVESMEMLGHLPLTALAREMSRASVMVLPSIEEGLALVQAMAMACGCPVIASEHTGARDLFEDGREGFIVPVGDVEAVADRLRRLHADRDLLHAMSEAAQARTRAMNGWGAYAEQVIAACAGLVARRRQGRL